eukprot:CAMPEP_0195124968 /NCGR_PEP_ID=MMETSP0448-20130528/132002_1 /TAXON_ID=66468 /ORGANISM="Heterocapsa triquestra, Strain CCMP 448" /LENGTH=46 /DNA_ID= /DNA_START= /DNA_END= /DNA_ORIENTATION=
MVAGMLLLVVGGRRVGENPLILLPLAVALTAAGAADGRALAAAPAP